MNAFVFDNSYQASLNTQMWGAEILLLREKYLPGGIFNWQWATGFRYVNLDEEYAMLGTSVNSRVTQIGGDAVNNIYGPQIGGRASIQTKYVTISATPKISASINDHTSSVVTGPLTLANESVVRVYEESIDFSPIFEINLKVQFHLGKSFTFFGGYDFLHMFNTSRPNHNIVYDSLPGTGGTFDPNIGQKVSPKDFYAKGFNLGAQFTY